MPLRHPSENFIKYLMTRDDPNMQQDPLITYAVTSFGFPQPKPDYLVWLRNDVTSRIPPDFTPHNKYHRASVKFLRQEGIYGLHNPDDAAREANLIVGHIRARPMIEQLLLGHIEPHFIAKKVNSRLGEHFTAAGIEAYKHYYWNVPLLRVEEWALLLSDDGQKKSKALAILQIGPQMALHASDFQQEIESKVMIREMLEAVYFDFQEWKKQPLSEARTKMIAQCVKSAAMLDERLSQADAHLKESLKAFENFRMQHSQRHVQDIRELAPSGNFTGSGARLLEAPDPDKIIEVINTDKKEAV
jgi:hypothetical protein